ncbi:MAG: DCC1-like thiol-disulfide oxidoreductase family protein [Bacteroidales bacterium]
MTYPHFTRHNAILLFDGICNLCGSLAQFIINHDREGTILLLPLQSPSGQSLLETHRLPRDDLDTVVFIKDGIHYTRSKAILVIFRHIGGGWKCLYGLIIIPAFIRDFIYRMIVKYRYRIFGRQKSCLYQPPSGSE